MTRTAGTLHEDRYIF